MYIDRPPGYDQLVHPPSYYEALEAGGHFDNFEDVNFPTQASAPQDEAPPVAPPVENTTHTTLLDDDDGSVYITF